MRFGVALDFWRVTGLEPGRKLRLRTEMKLPGEAELDFHIEPREEGRADSVLVQTARFKPRGLLGPAYWVAVLPLHGVVFRGMLRGAAREVERLARAAKPPAAGPHHQSATGRPIQSQTM